MHIFNSVSLLRTQISIPCFLDRKILMLFSELEWLGGTGKKFMSCTRKHLASSQKCTYFLNASVGKNSKWYCRCARNSISCWLKLCFQKHNYKEKIVPSYRWKSFHNSKQSMLEKEHIKTFLKY